ncbi:MAG: restriction endonuclease [Rhodoferax sp.]|nr:restriction endonuclease [Rhodoferax sp.]
MKLKIAPNSLFAILLRSPWWISIALVLAISLASRALLPAQYVVFGIIGALPFLVIGAVAAYQQLQTPSTDQVSRTLQNAAAMSWHDFSNALEQAYVRHGYRVTRPGYPATDLLLAKSGRRTLVAAKRWKAGNHGVEPLQALSAARKAQDTSNCIYITLGDVSEKTQRFAAQNGVELLSGTALAQLLHRNATAKK